MTPDEIRAGIIKLLGVAERPIKGHDLYVCVVYLIGRCDLGDFWPELDHLVAIGLVVETTAEAQVIEITYRLNTLEALAAIKS